MSASTPIRPAPPALVENGQIHTGFFALPPRKLRLLDAPLVGPRPLRWLRLKEWVGFGIHHERFFGGILIQNAKIAGSGTVFLYDKVTARHLEWQLVDLPWRVRLPEVLWQGQSLCQSGNNFLRFDHDLDHGRHTLTAQVAETADMPALALTLVAHQDLATTDPLVVSLPIGARHHTYTHKSPLRLEGSVRIGSEVHTFLPERDVANLDEQKTFYPYRSQWWWGCLATRTPEGREIMVNFVQQMTAHGQQGEDAVWIDGKLRLIPQPTIEALDTPGRWRIEAPGALRLTFQAVGAKTEKRNFGVAKMDYAQHYGPYEGEVAAPDGTWLPVSGAFGALERMVARF